MTTISRDVLRNLLARHEPRGPEVALCLAALGDSDTPSEVNLGHATADHLKRIYEFRFRRAAQSGLEILGAASFLERLDAAEADTVAGCALEDDDFYLAVFMNGNMTSIIGCLAVTKAAP